MKDTNSNKLLKFFLYLVVFTILAPMAILLLWTFVSRWPWPDLLPEAYSLRAIKDVFAPHTKIFSILFSNIL